MGHQESLDLIRNTGVVAIMRAKSSEQLLRAADAIREGGLGVIEVTMTTPGALAVIETAVGRYDQDVLFGAGTVLDAESARAAILAGAQFIVAPVYSRALIEICRRYSVPVMPGAFTPTEVATAWRSGADCVKLFPAGSLGIPYLKALRAPMPDIPIMPTGGVDVDNAADWLRAGAVALGVGSKLVRKDALATGDYGLITDTARKFMAAIAEARE